MNEHDIFPSTAMPDRGWWSALWPDPAGMLLSLGVGPGMTVLDLCCGDGYFTAPLARIVGGQVYALDIDPHLLDLARDEAEQAGVQVERWICGDAMDLVTLVPEQVDYVLIANTFHGVPDKEELVRLVSDALKPDGRFAIINWHRRPREETTVLDKPRGPKTETRMSPEQVRAVVEPNGFTLQQVVDLPPYHYGAVFRKNAIKSESPEPSIKESPGRGL